MNPSDMNDEQLRIAVAEALGLVWKKHIFKVGLPVQLGGWYDPLGIYIGSRTDELPNWPEDLNSCHEFEEAFTEDQRVAYTGSLLTMLQASYPHIKWWRMAHATARQRCIALLEVLKKEKP